MELFPSISTLALAASLALLLMIVLRRLRHRGGSGEARDALDTVGGWQPEASRVLTIDERQGYELLRRALPNTLVLAQVPLSRFIRVPMRHSYGDWLQRVGSLSVDLVICDSGSRPIAVIDIRAADESSRSRRRHDRMARVLRAAGIHVVNWRARDLPSVQQVRSTLSPLLGPATPAARPTASASRPMPLIPVAEMEELLADGDRAAFEANDAANEPVPSGFYDDLEAAAAAGRR